MLALGNAVLVLVGLGVLVRPTLLLVAMKKGPVSDSSTVAIAIRVALHYLAFLGVLILVLLAYQ